MKFPVRDFGQLKPTCSLVNSYEAANQDIHPDNDLPQLAHFYESLNAAPLSYSGTLTNTTVPTAFKCLTPGLQH